MQTEQFQLHADIEQRHWWFVGRRRIMRRLVAAVLPPSSQETTVINVGCGTGGNIGCLADEYRCVGIDTSAEAIDLARPRFPKVHFLQGRAPADLGPLMEEARLVLLMDVLEHVSDDFALLSELLAAAAPGPISSLTVPADMALWSEHDESFGHYRRYDQARLEKVWAGLPVTPRLVSYFNARLLPAGAAGAGAEPPPRSCGGAGGHRFLAAQPAGQFPVAGHSGAANRGVCCGSCKAGGSRATPPAPA